MRQSRETEACEEGVQSSERRAPGAAGSACAGAVSPSGVGWPASVARRAEVDPDSAGLSSERTETGQQVHAGARDQRRKKHLRSCHRVTSLPVSWCN